MAQEIEVEIEAVSKIPEGASVWSRFQQDQAGAIEKIVGIALVVLVTVGAIALIGAVVNDYINEIPDPGEVDTGLDG